MPDDLPARLELARLELELATADLDALSERCDRLIARAEWTGELVPWVDAVIVGAMGADAKHRGDSAAIAIAVLAAGDAA